MSANREHLRNSVGKFSCITSMLILIEVGCARKVCILNILFADRPESEIVINLLPNLNVDALARAFVEKSNDMHLVIYISSIVRSVVALHDLVQNKIKLKGVEGFEAGKGEKKKEGGDDASEEGKDGKKADEGEKTDKP